MPTTLTLTDRLHALARDAAGHGGEPDVLADRPDGTVVGLADVVAKAHPPTTSTGERELAVRLAVAAHPRLRGILLPP
ncbi:hypothetical protein AN218_16830, partial [Streptomyces nanshensis]